MASTDPAKEHQLILRLPKDYAERVREGVKTDTLGERLQLEFHKDPLGTMRCCKVMLDEDILSAKLVDLPTVIESHKTLDNKVLYKTGDIAQAIICQNDPPVEGGTEEEEEGEGGRVSMDEMTAAKKKELYKKFVWNHGITPPLKNVRKRRFRKTKMKKMIESPEVEKEVKRLLRADTFAVNVSFRVISEEDKQEDVQSFASDSLSSHHGQLLQDDDSLLSNSAASYSHLSDDKMELLKMLEEASCSSSSSNEEEEEEDEEEESEEEEISVVDQSPESQELAELRLTVQDLENQIEEQKLKIQNTPMPLLRARFETFLGELEKQRGVKMEELEQLLR